MQRKDSDLVDIIDYLENQTLPDNNKAARTLLRTIDDCYLNEHGTLCHLWSPTGRKRTTPRSQLFVPNALKYEILLSGHDDATAGHLGTFKTYEKLRSRYYWRGMFQDVQHWCRSCVDCSMKKGPRARHKAPLLPIPVEGAFDRVAVDCVGPLPPSKSGNRYLVVFSDYLTRWPEAFAVPTIDAPVIAKLFVNEILGRHGAPRTLLSDRGQNFMSILIREVCRLVNTEKVNTTAYHPQTDGLVERFNGTLVQSISMYVSSNQRDWDEHLQSVLFAYRVSPSETTGESPFYLLYGREPRLPMDVSLLAPSDLSPSIAAQRARIVQHIEEAQELARTNIQSAQQRMKLHYDQTATTHEFELGQKVWVYTPKTRKGLSRKLLHTWHGPYRIIKKLSPAHYLLRTATNNRVTTTVHVNRMKPYFDPNDRPIQGPPDDDIHAPYLAEHDLPDDSFHPETPATSRGDQPTPAPADTTGPSADSNQSSADPLDDPNVFLVDRILKMRNNQGKHEYFIKWKGYSSRHNTWEPEENILNAQLLADFHKRNPSHNAVLVPDSPTIACLTPRARELPSRLSVFVPTPPRPSPRSTALFHVPFFALLLLCLTALILPVHTFGYGCDAAHQRVVYYPGSLMISHHSKAMVFYTDTTIVNIKSDLDAATYGPDMILTNNCSIPQQIFLNKIIQSTRSIQRVIRRLISMQGATNLIECDSYLRRFYQYSTGLTPTMTCPRGYQSSLKACKSWALNHCSHFSHHQRAWLQDRSRRSSWWCHAGLLGLFRALYEATGHSCEPNHVSNLKETMWAMFDVFTDVRHMIHTINGKTVILTKVTDALHTKVNSLISALHGIDSTFHQWRASLLHESQANSCHFNLYLEFFSKYSTEINRVFASVLRLTEIEDVVKQASVISTKDIVGYKDLPNFMVSEISIRFASLSSMSLTAKALTAGFSLLLQPMVDYEYERAHRLQLNLLLTLPQIASDNDFRVIEYITPLKYNVSHTCYTGPVARADLALVSCPNRRFLLPVAALQTCFQDDTTAICPHSVLVKLSDSDWLGLPWTPNTKFAFPRLHSIAPDCSNLHYLLHLGGRHYLSTTSRLLPVTGLTNTSLIRLSPLMVYHFPCDVTFPSQQTGFGTCPSQLEITVPIFTPTHVSYVPWHPAMDNSALNLHYASLTIPPRSTFNRSTLDSLDRTFTTLDGHLVHELHTVRQDISNIQETSTTSLNDILTYFAFGLASLHTTCLLIYFCHSSRRPCARANRPRQSTSQVLVSDTPDVELLSLSCEKCHKPRRQRPTSTHL